MPWQAYFHAEFEPEFDALSHEVQDELLAHANLLKQFGPQLKRPTADQKRFYRQLIKTADARFDRHLASLKARAKGKGRREQ